MNATMDATTLGIFLDDEYVIDIALLQKEFAAFDTADPMSLQRWFTDHSYLASNDRARIAGVCPRTIRRFCARAGLAPKVRHPPPGWRRPASALVPAVCRTGELITGSRSNTLISASVSWLMLSGRSYTYTEAFTPTLRRSVSLCTSSGVIQASLLLTAAGWCGTYVVDRLSLTTLCQGLRQRQSLHHDLVVIALPDSDSK